MEVLIHDRTNAVGKEFRDYATKRVERLADHFHPIASAELEFDSDAKRRQESLHIVKMTLHLLGHRLPNLRVHTTGKDLRGTFDLMMDKAHAEITRLKEKTEEHSCEPLHTTIE